MFLNTPREYYKANVELNSTDGLKNLITDIKQTEADIIESLEHAYEEFGRMSCAEVKDSVFTEKTLLELEAEICELVEQLRQARTRLKLAFMELGRTSVEEEKELPPAEKKREFDQQLRSLNSVTFKYDHLRGNRQQAVYTLENNRVFVNGESSESSPMKMAMTKEEFLEGLRRINIWEWNARYDAPYVLDGYSWSVTFDFDDGYDPLKVSGYVNSPLNFPELEKFLRVWDCLTDIPGTESDVPEWPDWDDANGW